MKEHIFPIFESLARTFLVVYKFCLKEELLNHLTLEEFIWAFSVLKTRQNNVPWDIFPQEKELNEIKSKKPFQIALIPLYDFFNHKKGNLSTDFSKEDNSVICYSMQHVKKGDQVYIFYGPRNNYELIVNNGFLDVHNENTRFAMTLAVDVRDKQIATKKADAMSKVGLRPIQMFKIMGFSEAILNWMRINEADAPTLKSIIKGTLDLKKPISIKNELSALHALLSLFDDALGKYDEDYNDKIEKFEKGEGGVSYVQYMCMFIIQQEKKLLTDSRAAFLQYRESISKTQQTTTQPKKQTNKKKK